MEKTFFFVQNDVVGRGGFNLPRPILAGFQKTKKDLKGERRNRCWCIVGPGTRYSTEGHSAHSLRRHGWLVGCLLGSRVTALVHFGKPNVVGPIT